MSRLASLFLGREPEEKKKSPKTDSERKKPRYTILFVDDEVGVLKAMKRIFYKENYHILTAESAEDALKLLKENTIQVVISDHRMPGMKGTDLLREVKATYPNTIRIMLTGHADVDAVMGAVNDGAVYKFITKPWNDDDLRLTVSLALEQYDLLKENLTLKKQSHNQKKQLKQLSRFINVHKSQLGRLLLKEGLISQEDLDAVFARQAKTNEILPKILMDLDLIDEASILKVIQKKQGINRVSLKEFQIHEALVAMIPKEICERNILIPIKQTENMLVVAMADPTDFNKLDDLKFITGLTIEPALASQKEIKETLGLIYKETGDLESVLSEIDMSDPTETIEIILEEDDEETDIKALLKETDQPPAIRIVNAIISDALRHGASDVHIEPKTKYVMVRYRIDDLLQDKLHIPLPMHQPIVSRIKIMSELDISERRRPQDGRITVKTSSRIVDMRISTLPTINGEKVVFRILDKNAAAKDLNELGFSPSDLHKVTRFIEQPQGIILTTGPTGSGKTSSLYALLRKGAKITKNFTTIEDPVEFHMSMAEQVNVRDKIGLNFSTVLRSILRQDPNVIMLGEIRDFETAEVAFHAALTGHLVLSTLHTNSAIASIIRLKDMGIKPYIISDALIGVIAQRLVRKICPHCLTDDKPGDKILRALKLNSDQITPKKGTGCPKCYQSGYKGRLGVFEIFVIDSEIKRMIHREATEVELLRSAKLTGMSMLIDDAISKVNKGLTTLEEVLRVFGPQDTLEIYCPHCQYVFEERFIFCPSCGKETLPHCHDCGKNLDASWHHCPFCGKKSTAGKP